MPNILEHKKYVFCSANINSNKVWEVVLFDNDDVEVRFGRIGKSLQTKLHPSAGRRKMESLIRDKTRPSDHYDGGCYREIETLDSSSLTPAKIASAGSKNELKQIAKTQIATCAITQKLIEFFTDVNAHDIYKATGGRITYDVSAGTFKTPIGVVTSNNIINARDLLDKLTDFVTKRNFSRKFITTLEDYLMLIPQDVGRKFEPLEFCGDVTAIQKQSQILDGLEASVQAILSSPKDKKSADKKQTPELFQVKLKIVDESREIARIQKYFDEGRKGVHVSSRMKLQQVYSVDMITMKNAYEKDGKNMKNIQELWHGTKPSNILSILKSGFMIPPSSASHVCGRAFGNGCYFSNSSTKSLNYSTSYWGGKDEGRYFMFLCDVALGNFYIPQSTTPRNPPTGYDSYWAKAGKSGVINDELIVFRTSQILPKYITEWR